jgi:uncharacterized repeat protein (TIGR04076 family)
MRNTKMEIPGNVWTSLQERLGYSDEELSKFKESAGNQRVLRCAPELMTKTIVAEVVYSHGCNSQHKVGDKFYMDGSGNLLSKLCPSRMCVYAVSALRPLVYAAHELFYNGVDPNKMVFNHCGCVDVGLECGGWGRVVMEVRMEDRNRDIP